MSTEDDGHSTRILRCSFSGFCPSSPSVSVLMLSPCIRENTSSSQDRTVKRSNTVEPAGGVIRPAAGPVKSCEPAASMLICTAAARPGLARLAVASTNTTGLPAGPLNVKTELANPARWVLNPDRRLRCRGSQSAVRRIGGFGNTAPIPLLPRHIIGGRVHSQKGRQTRDY